MKQGSPRYREGNQKAYLKAATPLNAISGFKKTGIFPVDRYVFTDDMFVAAIPTDLPVNNNISPPAVNPIPENENVVETEPGSPHTSTLGILTERQQNESPRTPSPQPSTSGTQTVLKCDTSQINKQGTLYFSPEYFYPYPKVVSKNTSNIKRKTGKTAILTSTPYKDELSENIKNKRNRDAGQGKRNLVKKNKKIESKKSKGKLNPPIRYRVENDSSDAESDPECFYCGNSFTSSKKGEGWIRCEQCLKWVHDACAGAEENEENFICDKCL